MTQSTRKRWLDRPVEAGRDHVLETNDAPITLVEYGSYACPYCRAANESIAKVRDRLGESLRYVFRHRPLANSPLARRAAELVKCVSPEDFWRAHVELMTRSPSLQEDDLRAVAAEFSHERMDDPELLPGLRRRAGCGRR
ncbi:DsbA family protein [Aestuariivirga sp.]|uniref:DsbA family protein n=1 Tax=Aestuariivirga sp. TaxID=2650926 RepID=UPI00391A394F